MVKKFFDVFPFLQVDDKVRQFLEETEVERVSSTKKKDLLRIYMVSGRLMEGGKGNREDAFFLSDESKDL